jgi:hypothetical protein
MNDPKSFAMAFLDAPQTTVGAFPVTIDLTDSNGNGMLIATDSLYVVAANVSGTASEAICKVFYRLVNVGITEYVGIVQSQQV